MEFIHLDIKNTQQLIPRIDRRNRWRGICAGRCTSHSNGRADENPDLPLCLSDHWICHWVFGAQDHPFLVCGHYAPHQSFFQEKSDHHRPCAGTESRQQRRAKDNGYHYSCIGHWWISKIVSSSALGGRHLRRGTYFWHNGWRMVIDPQTGNSFYKIRPVDGFSTQVTSAVIIIGASIIGGPVSATQVINTAIMGVGVAERANKVRWGIAKDIITAWGLTIPATALVAAGIYWIVIRYIP